MAPRWIIIDGYSLLHRSQPPTAGCGDTARRRLINMLDKIANVLAERVTVVFDGRGPKSEMAQECVSLEIIFSPASQTADTVIERMVCSAVSPQEILIVSSDRMERQTVEAAGAQTISCGDFLDNCRKMASQIEQTTKRSVSGASQPTLGDFFPKSK